MNTLRTNDETRGVKRIESAGPARPVLVLAWLLCAGAACDQQAPPAGPRRTSLRPPAAAGDAPNSPDEAKRVPRPLDKAMEMAKSSLESIAEIEDYSCTFVKRERVGDELLDQQRLTMKVRHEPFSVYMRFIEPESLAGREAIYVEGRNDGKLLAHATGLRGKILGRMALEPTGFFAMIGNRHPITTAGMKRLLGKLIELGERMDALEECRVQFVEGVEVDKRPCTLVKITHPRVEGEFRLAIARIYLDREWNLPVRFETYDWPDDGSGKPILVEQYTYLDLKFNQDLSDSDFDPGNAQYEFPE
ncbi:MAG: DUF1571 domain-containing protein [Pirellulales bacterium]